ncbi:hypothetical protein VPHK397_0126 [Vibrio phage K397]
MLNVNNLKLKFTDLSEPKLVLESDKRNINAFLERVCQDGKPLYLAFTHSPDRQGDECWVLSNPEHIYVNPALEYCSLKPFASDGEREVTCVNLNSNHFPVGEAHIIKLRG